MSKYKTIKGEASSEYKEKSSRFLSYATGISSEHEAQEFIKKIAARHHKARHVCFAWIYGTDSHLFRYSDANEPSHTAGLPILNQIKKAGLVNVVVVVVRYFGGVLLGKGGLIRAYSMVAAQALENAEITENEETAYMEIELHYNQYHHVMEVINPFEVRLLAQDYGEICKIKFSYRLDDKAKLLEGLEKYDVKVKNTDSGIN